MSSEKVTPCGRFKLKVIVTDKGWYLVLSESSGQQPVPVSRWPQRGVKKGKANKSIIDQIMAWLVSFGITDENVVSVVPN